MCRGQSNSSWKLTTSFHRMNSDMTLAQYSNTLPFIADWLSTINDRHFDINCPKNRASLLSILQHSGFPTPLLDWSLSPYIAAYFAFSGVNDKKPESDNVSIYIFDYHAWNSKWKSILDLDSNDQHVSILQPNTMGNMRQINQQGLFYMFTNVFDIEDHICRHEINDNYEYLQKYTLSIKERPLAMNDLESMGINAFSLFGGVEGLCEYLKESFFRKKKINQTPSDQILEFLSKFRSN